MDAFPFHWMLDLQSAPVGGSEFAFAATEAECQELARLLGIDGVTGFAASLRVKPERKNIYLIRGDVTAAIFQTCVVTLEPVESQVTEAVDVRIKTNADPREMEQFATRNMGFTHDDRDPTEPIEGSVINAAQLTTEFLAIGIDPYPRKPGVTFDSLTISLPPEASTVGQSDDDTPSPFGVLASWRNEGNE